jgi:hypothetical protein
MLAKTSVTITCGTIEETLCLYKPETISHHSSRNDNPVETEDRLVMYQALGEDQLVIVAEIVDMSSVIAQFVDNSRRRETAQTLNRTHGQARETRAAGTFGKCCRGDVDARKDTENPSNNLQPQRHPSKYDS